MSHPDSAFFVFDNHASAEDAIRTLGRSGFDTKKLSLVGKGYHSEEKPMGFYTGGDRIKAWGGTGAFWGGIWGLLLAPAVFVLPGLGVPKDQVIKYEAALKVDKYLLAVHGGAEDQEKARNVLGQSTTSAV